ncbi:MULTISPECIES: aminotransferase class V-fold PLP-dependent enzyme [unclassified Tolypothrix]|uniref:aminotransferase class V-fold PLP-dependent enzyme n=1 Tax=unclassified Tolypothrix TaxID=2649714 RepID=UPI0005EAC568|nr:MULTISPECIES: aminotransferase class V-fold PLP-dependent enzyme [unclassified Tolypothrix]BAY94271.1 class V aminotransferase [Microchaete diplosiphon NIES-3275]EKF03980.1 aminotransferase, class V [Tolypothrix sp. PCC 7601]MBE9085606.1 aminotransferase class V-fold PLP-dependent enzyme [Tolypothrix sp. LEGE 11397]UYD28010.1 aminotransferase class V-fold PLP-dependent enzyme [Tolypothrix sp. PCC 7712]UYD36120.1 aminotransferase class V-fold PLP-dependent enzyme [Tolypothrix sp. PCC 7601]
MSLSDLQQSLHRHREQFPALANKTYFNYGGQGPMPLAAIKAISENQMHIQQLGPFGNEVGRWIGKIIQATKAAIASELNVPPSTITLTENVTVGCNIAMWGIEWQTGDHILLSDCEHQGIIAIAQEIGRRFNVEVTTCPLMDTLNVGDPVEVISQNLRPNTRLVVLSHILWNTGQLLPLDKIAELCRNNNSLLLVDAAQSVGAMPLNLTQLGVDFYAFTGHKWLCGPAGVGGLYVRPEVQANLQPTFVGWRSVVIDERSKPVDWEKSGQRYEVATSDYPLYVALQEAIAIHQQWGTPEERYQQICHNSEYLWRKLSALPNIKCLRTSSPESGLISFQLANQLSQTTSEVVQLLESQKIFTRKIADPNCVRACVHYFTLESEIDQLVEALRE